jgi:hypothetical protein
VRHGRRRGERREVGVDRGVWSDNCAPLELLR